MLSSKCFQAALLVIAMIGLGFAPAGDALAGSCNNDRLSHGDRWNNRSYGGSNHYRNNSHRDYSHRNSSRSRVNVTYRNDNVRFSVGFGSDRSHRSRDYHQPRYHQPVHRSSNSCNTTVVYQHPQSGYWKRVYHSPVYETRYDSCGRPYRVCVRAGYYERVWVTTGRRY
ncbi:MAG: hypothetical protein AB8C95_04550 [Phycisphaeraceae bacterium]